MIESYNYIQGNITGLVETSLLVSTGTTPLKPHFHDEIQITHITKGLRSYIIAGKRVTANVGEIVIIAPGAPHQAAIEPAGSSRWVNFYVSPDTVSVLAIRRLISLKCAIGKTVGFHRDSTLQIERTIFEAPDTAFHRPIRNPFGTSSFSDIMAMLVESLSIDEVAQDFLLSREGFTRAFTKSFGLAPYSMLLNVRLNRSRFLLRQGASISETAHETGFSDQSHMGRLFRKHFGISPGSYKRGFGN